MRLATPDSQTSAGEPRVARACGGSRALCGWSPPPLAADTGLKRRADRLVAGALPAVVMIAAVAALLNVAPLRPGRGELGADGLAALAGGGWCSVNFWRCRHAHCLVTGPGWLALSVLAFTEATVGHSFIAGDEQLVLLGVLAAALLSRAAGIWPGVPTPSVPDGRRGRVRWAFRWQVTRRKHLAVSRLRRWE